MEAAFTCLPVVLCVTFVLAAAVLRNAAHNRPGEPRAIKKLSRAQKRRQKQRLAKQRSDNSSQVLSESHHQNRPSLDLSAANINQNIGRVARWACNTKTRACGGRGGGTAAAQRTGLPRGVWEMKGDEGEKEKKTQNTCIWRLMIVPLEAV
jgi:hypothetical protein